MERMSDGCMSLLSPHHSYSPVLGCEGKVSNGMCSQCEEQTVHQFAWRVRAEGRPVPSEFDHDYTFDVTYGNLVPLRSDCNASCAFKSVAQCVLQSACARVPGLDCAVLRTADY